MGESAIIQIAYCPFVWVGIGYDKQFKELAFLFPFGRLSIQFKKKTDSNKWFEVV